MGEGRDEDNKGDPIMLNRVNRVGQGSLMLPKSGA